MPGLCFHVFHQPSPPHLPLLLQAGQRHPSVSSLHVESCAAITGANLVANGASFTSLRHLWLEGCDLLNG